MRDPNRIDDGLRLIEVIWKQNPDWRFGQLVQNLYDSYRGHRGTDMFYIEDDEFFYWLHEILYEGRKD